MSLERRNTTKRHKGIRVEIGSDSFGGKEFEVRCLVCGALRGWGNSMSYQQFPWWNTQTNEKQTYCPGPKVDE